MEIRKSMIDFEKKVNKISIHAYKFNGCLYRTFEFPKIVYENDKIIVLNLDKVRIISQGKNKKFYHSHSKNDSYWVMFKDEWYNLLVTICNNQNKIIYYFNIATPFIYEEEAIKYIDLDLDIRLVIYGDSTSKILKVLDLNEFDFNAKRMNYPKKLIDQAILAKNTLIDKIKNTNFIYKYNNDFFKEIMVKYKDVNR